MLSVKYSILFPPEITYHSFHLARMLLGLSGYLAGTFGVPW